MATKLKLPATQISFDFTAPESAPQLKDIKVGECFSLPTVGAAYMRVAPVKTLVRSTMVHEVLTRGDCFVVCLDTGMLTVMSYSTQVQPFAARISLSPL